MPARRRRARGLSSLRTARDTFGQGGRRRLRGGADDAGRGVRAEIPAARAGVAVHARGHAGAGERRRRAPVLRRCAGRPAPDVRDLRPSDADAARRQWRPRAVGSVATATRPPASRRVSVRGLSQPRDGLDHARGHFASRLHARRAACLFDRRDKARGRDHAGISRAHRDLRAACRQRRPRGRAAHCRGPPRHPRRPHVAFRRRATRHPRAQARAGYRRASRPARCDRPSASGLQDHR